MIEQTNGGRLPRLLGHAALGAMAMALLAVPAAAQTAEPVVTPSTPDAPPTTPGGEPTTPAADGSGDTTITVTGSRIRGIAPVGSAVIALDAQKIQDEPVISTNDVLRRVPQVVSLGANRAGGSAQNGAANATRGAGINLRGLSTNATLLLYDGRRFPPQGTQGQFTDPSVIPSIALARVEVVADGSSAIYGSDAVAGVVNLILRRNFSGLEARARYGMTDGDYREKQIALLGGQRWNGGYVTLAGEYSQNNTLFGSELDFFQNDNRARGGRDLRVANCAPGTITSGGVAYAIPAGGVTAANASALTLGTNRCFYDPALAVIPNQKRYSVVGNASQELGGVRLFVDGFWSRRNGTLPLLANVNATVPSTNPFYVAPPGSTPGLCAGSVGVPAGTRCVTVATSLFPSIGVITRPYHSKSWNGSAGIEFKPFGDFRATGYFAHGRSEEVDDRRRNGVNAAALQAALNSTDPATAFNVFGGPNNPATIATITDNLFVITGRTRLSVFNGQLDGSLFELPGGKVRIAVGAEHRNEYTYTELLSGRSASPLRVADAGSRDVDAVFGELFVPIVGSGNAMTGIERLNLSLALRHENYSDFGSTTNPKIGVTYQPLGGVVLKATYGTSFRAPTFTEVSTIAGGAGLYFDTLPGPSGNLQGIGIAGGNPDLKPETAKTWSAGVELAPRALRGFVATLNYFHIDYTDQIQALRGTPGLLTNPLYSQFVQFNPSAAQVAALVGSGLPINSAINQSLVTFIADGRRQNLGTTKLRGIDFTATYNWKLGAAEFDAGVQGTYITDYLFEAVPGSGLVDVRNTIGFNQKFRSQADIGARLGGARTRLTWNHLSGYDNTTITPRQRIGAYNTLDLLVGYDLNERIGLTFDVRNLLNEDPPFVDTTGGYDPQASNPVPRLYALTASVKF
ncbi:iron complex outermembrane receptor protein [Sphingomonas kaistensis]|uniref:Iron complex outermembrane receptor protein n=1 Tax=Sphingomonas kaistensis TaxID=298708 RepID=A0A7X5Y458_9SPHN|nr:TonB-dependent receptor [Sphingomonas kaistensis]NJC04410.1 iron complex outermembrane receptor protein [Sphingomonas kaistensis]